MLSILFSNNEINWITVVCFIIAALINIFLSLPVHELSHGLIAYKLGDPTAKNMGRLTFNPFAHIDWMGAALIIVVGFGWAKPVPVNMRNFKKPKLGMALTALAGPVSNIILALLALLLSNCSLFIGNLIINSGSVSYGDITFLIISILITIFTLIAQINVCLAVFNLVPIPPLDGSRILNAFLPDRVYYNLMRYERYTFLAVLVLAYFGGDYLGILVDKIMYGLNLIAFIPFM